VIQTLDAIKLSRSKDTHNCCRLTYTHWSTTTRQANRTSLTITKYIKIAFSYLQILADKLATICGNANWALCCC